MENQQQQQIRFMLHAWRENAIARLGFTPDQVDYCARHSIVMHDIFIDAIARAAPGIRCLEDFHAVAYYWKWIDQYGDEVYALIRNYLDTPKRLTEDVEAVSRKRVRCA
ncbi:hypothetical protein B9G98_01240 [Wickerhamiella sorbophila]|uniref:Uncharacterized protein n=1 Tax=Wickerhamiella sorbophila TaxID=45607 RepID=A0A2T0FF71_9ASCO|nr:hypothetical protein B9G98_01240 [Wickerhamiella sorbophila]PRT53620.1 hypothetical protein B9G98_01240 [Wickerhamiella sorbophila]